MKKPRDLLFLFFLLTPFILLPNSKASGKGKDLLLADSRKREIEEEVKKTVQEYDEDVKEDKKHKEDIQKYLDEEVGKGDDELEIEEPMAPAKAPVDNAKEKGAQGSKEQVKTPAGKK